MPFAWQPSCAGASAVCADEPSGTARARPRRLKVTRLFRGVVVTLGCAAILTGSAPKALAQSLQLPGTLQAEDFDQGASGVAYVDTTNGNAGGAYRSTNVDIEATSDTGGGYDVGWVTAGEWLRYTVNVSAAGLYDLEVRVAARGAGGTFHIEINGVDSTGPLTIPATGGWQDWTTLRKSGLNLTAGTQVWRVVMDQNGEFAVGNINFFRVVSASPAPAPAPAPVPAPAPNPSPAPAPAPAPNPSPAPSPAPAPTAGDPSGGDIVLYTSDVTTTVGNWVRGNYPTGAGGQAMQSNDAGWSNPNEALPAPPDFFEARFTPEANKPYRVWMRLRANADSKFNESVWLQFSGAVDAEGAPLWRIGTTSALLVNLESCTGCGVSGWGWQTGAWWVAQDSIVRFSAPTEQILRVQTREDGARIDQIVLSATTYFDSPPGAPINDTTIVPKKSATTTTPSSPSAPSAAAPAAVGNAKPTTSITSPANGASFSAPATILITAAAADADGTVTRLDFNAGNQFLNTKNSSPWTYTWRNIPAGTYALRTIAVDNSGGITYSEPVTVTVGNSANATPVAAISSPSNGATFTAPANITINATASDSNGSVTRVDFYAGTQLIGNTSTAPYAVTWNNAPAGTYALTAVARDNGGASGTSSPVNVTVNPAGPPPSAGTTLAFTASPDHNARVTSYSVAIFRADAPTSAPPVDTATLGKPPAPNGEIAVDISGMVNSLPVGWYYVIVTAHDSSQVAASAPSTPFPK